MPNQGSLENSVLEVHPSLSFMIISGFGTLGRECAERTGSFHPHEVRFQEQSCKSNELLTDHKPGVWTLPLFLSINSRMVMTLPQLPP